MQSRGTRPRGRSRHRTQPTATKGERDDRGEGTLIEARAHRVSTAATAVAAERILADAMRRRDNQLCSHEARVHVDAPGTAHSRRRHKADRDGGDGALIDDM